jgi:quercetin dioxygenase-like cupin family protein
MNITYPYTIENNLGEKLIFRELLTEAGVEKLLVENYVAPGIGPVMHTHWLQDECLTVVDGQIGYQVQGGEEQFAGPGETVLFKRGTPHRFWNAGPGTLHCKGWIQPANTIVFFLSSIFEAQNKTGSPRPELFDAAYLLTRYRKEYDMAELPNVVKKTLIPITYLLGKAMGKYKKFRDAPEPVTA